MNHWMLNRPNLALVLLACMECAGLAIAARGEVPNRSPEWLREHATHVITGEVISIYERKSTEGNFKVTRYIAEVRVKSAEKGAGLAPEQVTYVRYFHRSQRGLIRVADTNGHRELAQEGETLRLYLGQNASDGFERDNNDGGYNVMFPNGFERLPKAPEPADAKP